MRVPLLPSQQESRRGADQCGCHHRPPGEPGVDRHDGADELHDGKARTIHQKLCVFIGVSYAQIQPHQPGRAAVCTQSLNPVEQDSETFR
jgi:hypothetical protein